MWLNPVQPMGSTSIFGSLVEELFAKVKSNTQEITTLTVLLDVLLPRLVSGGVGGAGSYDNISQMNGPHLEGLKWILRDNMRYSNQTDGCHIWPGYPGLDFWNGDGSEIHVEQSPRAGGSYTITREAKWRIDDNGDNGMEDSHKARLTSALVDQRRLGIKWPKVTTELIEATRTAQVLSVHKRVDRLLRYLGNSTTGTGEFVSLGTLAEAPDSFGHRTLSEGPTFWEAMAWSESTKGGEVQFFVDYLLDKGWIKGQREGHGMGHFAVTIDGHSHIADVETNVDSSQAFVAMWFDQSMNGAYNRGIRAAIENTGYKAFKINDKPDVDKIDDEIIGEIRRSRFLVADFTHGAKGARGGVYYEAGFAYGLGLHVVRSCRKDMIDKDELHFDVRQHYHVVWETIDELREGLEKRIRALIGEGPNVNR